MQDAFCKIFQRDQRYTEIEKKGQRLMQNSANPNINTDQCTSSKSQSLELQQNQSQSSRSPGPNSESVANSEQQNSGQRSTRQRSGQRSVIKPKNKFSSILSEITEEDEQSISQR